MANWTANTTVTYTRRYWLSTPTNLVEVGKMTNAVVSELELLNKATFDDTVKVTVGDNEIIFEYDVTEEQARLLQGRL